MALSRRAMDEIHSFELNRDGDTGICLLKQKTTPEVGHLIISLGGSGADMLREVKGLINRNCCSDDDKHKKPERVSFVAFDTDAHEREKASSKKTGRVILDDNELIILSDSGLPILLNPNIRDMNRTVYPWIYRWLDTQIPVVFGGNGAGSCRQAGRAMLFLEIDKVIEKLRTAILELTMGAHVLNLNIYILSGVSGGTGGGTCLDMAYIVRHVADMIAGPMSVHIFGYLLMPDVNLQNAIDAFRPTLLKNAGAALQELDNAMKLPETGDYYECQYSNTLTVRTNKAPFDYVHLISAKARGKGMPAEPYQHCLDTVAGSILCFVSGRQAFGAAAGFPVDALYGNIASTQLQARAMNAYKERSNCYLSIGYDCWEIPADRLVKYVFTLMFSKIDDLFKNEPVQGDADRFMEKMGYYCEDLVGTLMGQRTNPLNPAQFDRRMLFGRNSIRLEEYLPFDEKCREIDCRFHDLMGELGTELKEELQESFRDVERGPIWTSHLLVETSPLIDPLDHLILREKHRAVSLLTVARDRCLFYMREINRLHETTRVFAGKRKVEEYIGAWNEYFNSFLEAHCYDLLIGNEAALAETGENYQRGFFDEVLNTAAKYNNKWLDVTKQVLEELRIVVRNNTDEFTRISAQNYGRGLNWRDADIPDLDLAINNIIDKAGISKSDLLQAFLDRLLDKADKWAENVEFRKFIEEFLDFEAQPVLNASLENILNSCIRLNGGGPLSQSVGNDLMPEMMDGAVPLFDGYTTNYLTQVISIPQGCPQIQQGVGLFINYRNGYNLQTSYLRNRISVISMAVGLSLHDYFLYEKCELQLGLDPNAHGVFLNQGDTGFPGARNDMKLLLPSVIPTRKRSKYQKAPERFKEFERNLVEEFREMRTGRYPFLYFRKTADLQDYDLDLVLSVDLNHSPYSEMIEEENYLNYNHEVDSRKLTQLIEELKDIRYNTGLPEKTTLPKRLVISRYLLHEATWEMKDRYAGLHDKDAEKIKEEVAWEVAEWFYVSAYSFYKWAKEEKAKYDEIEKKIEELEGLLDEVNA